MPATDHWFSRLGFEVFHSPGISRAWRYEFDDGRFLLVTDLGGYDLPEPGGPYSAILLSRSNEVLEMCEFLPTQDDMFGCFDRIRRTEVE
jgi:hypothetical protein